MTYATITHLQTRYSEYQLRLMTDANGQVFNEAAALTALSDAGDEIDTYLGQRYILPLINTQSTNDDVIVEPHPVLVRIACDIAVYRLQTLRPKDDIEDARLRYDDAIKSLKGFASGSAILNYRQLRDDVAQGNADNASAGIAIMGQPPSLFGRANR